MDNAIYTSLTRQEGLLRAMDVIAANLANMNTVGYRREDLIFSEYVTNGGGEGGLSMTAARVRFTDHLQGAFDKTGGTLDFAIEGDAFFEVETPNGRRLTRAGAFVTSPEGAVTTMDGFAVLSAGGAPVFVPPEAKSLVVTPDGVVVADGAAVDQFGLVTVADPSGLRHEGGTLLEPTTPTVPAVGASIRQGYLEGSNVNAVAEITRMIEVQRSYELGQALMEKTDELAQSVIKTLGHTT